MLRKQGSCGNDERWCDLPYFQMSYGTHTCLPIDVSIEILIYVHPRNCIDSFGTGNVFDEMNANMLMHLNEWSVVERNIECHLFLAYEINQWWCRTKISDQLPSQLVHHNGGHVWIDACGITENAWQRIKRTLSSEIPMVSMFSKVNSEMIPLSYAPLSISWKISLEHRISMLVKRVLFEHRNFRGEFDCLYTTITIINNAFFFSFSYRLKLYK